MTQSSRHTCATIPVKVFPTLPYCPLDSTLSLLEARSGHIIPGLIQTWGCADRLERDLGTPFFDCRSDRKGRPADAWAELQFLHALQRTAYAQRSPKRSEDAIKWP